MLQKVLDTSFKKRLFASTIFIFVGLVLYLFGVTFVLILTIPLVLTFTVRFPAIINSYFSRYIVSTLLFYSVIQVAATIQFFLFPDSNFGILAIIISALTLLLAVVLYSKESVGVKPRSVFNWNDCIAFLCAAIFFVPMLFFVFSSDSVQLVSFGGIQGIDGVNHSAYIAEMNTSQHYVYKVGANYPGGFHIATAFIQNGLGVMQGDTSWLAAARYYIIQYAIFGALLLYGFYYLAISFVSILFKKVKLIRTIRLGVALSLGTSIALLFFSSFLYHGFLNYFYICASIVFGLLYLLSKPWAKQDKLTSATGFIILSLGASMSWPLWTPVVLLSALLYILHEFEFTKRNVFSWKVLLLFLSVGLHLVPIYFQLKYSGSDASQGVNLTGGLRTFHYLLVGASVGGLAIIITGKYVHEAGRQLILQIFIPMFLLLGALLFLQYFTYGEIRYYTIKSALLIEMLAVVLYVATLASMYAQRVRSNSWYSVVFLPLTACIGVALLMAASGNPLQDARSLFRGGTTEEKPAFFDNDITKLSALGEEGKITKANVVSMHVSDTGKLYTHAQAFYWADMMGYTGEIADREAYYCAGDINVNIFAQDFSDASQQKLIQLIRTCALNAKTNNITYYIITDEQSKGRLIELFGTEAIVL